jgi:hypothetical protein
MQSLSKTISSPNATLVSKSVALDLRFRKMPGLNLCLVTEYLYPDLLPSFPPDNYWDCTPTFKYTTTTSFHTLRNPNIQRYTAYAI